MGVHRDVPSVSTNGIETYYERRGSGHPIVFIHGSGWDYRQWMPQLITLAEDYDVICYDVRGHGETGGSNDESVTFGTFADDLKSFIEALDLESPTLVGLSMGGRIAHICAATYPSLPGSIVVYEAPVRLEPLSPSLATKAMLQIHSTVYRYLGPYRAYKLFNWYQRRFGNVEDGEPGSVAIDGLDMTKDEYIRDAIRQVDTDEQLKLKESFGERVDTPSEIAVPALVLTGDGADSFNVEAADQLAAEIPDANRDTVQDAGHTGNIDNPNDFNRKLQEFISTVHPVGSQPR